MLLEHCHAEPELTSKRFSRSQFFTFNVIFVRYTHVPHPIISVRVRIPLQCMTLRISLDGPEPNRNCPEKCARTKWHEGFGPPPSTCVLFHVHVTKIQIQKKVVQMYFDPHILVFRLKPLHLQTTRSLCMDFIYMNMKRNTFVCILLRIMKCNLSFSQSK